jgi:hypothetical protein
MHASAQTWGRVHSIFAINCANHKELYAPDNHDACRSRCLRWLTHTYICVNVYIYICIHTLFQVCLYTYKYMYMYIYIYTYVYMYRVVYVYTRSPLYSIYVYIYIYRSVVSLWFAGTSKATPSSCMSVLTGCS